MEQVKPYIKILHRGDRITITCEPQGNELLTVQRDGDAIMSVIRMVEIMSTMDGHFEIVQVSDWIEDLENKGKWTDIRDRLLGCLERGLQNG